MMSGHCWMVLMLLVPCAQAQEFPDFPNGVASGEVTAESAQLWAHCTKLGSLTFELDQQPDFSQAMLWQTNVSNTNVPVKLPVTALKPGQQYYYRVSDSDQHAVSGQFKTAFLPQAYHGLKFGVSGDSRGELRPFFALANAVDIGLDFFVALGDTIYADFPSPDFNLPQARSLDEFRVKQSEVYSARFGQNYWATLRGTTALWAMIDDHEVINNFAGGALVMTDPRFQTATNSPAAVDTNQFINRTPLYQNGIQAFEEFHPLLPRTYNTPGYSRMHERPKLYRQQMYGRDAMIFIVDTRSFRDQPLSEVKNILDSSQIRNFHYRSFDMDPTSGRQLPARTLLGDIQLDLLKTGLAEAQTNGICWKFVFVPEPIENLGFADGQDRFEGYARERRDLLHFIQQNGVDNVVFVSADIHGTVVNNLFYQEAPDGPQIPCPSFEIVVGPIAYDKPFGPTAFDAAEHYQLFPNVSLLSLLLQNVGISNRTEFDSLPMQEKDAKFKTIMDLQLAFIGLDPTGLEGSPLHAIPDRGGYVAVHTYGWTLFEISPTTHRLTLTTFGVPAYGVDRLSTNMAPPTIMSRFSVDAFPPALRIARGNDKIRVSWDRLEANGQLESAQDFGPNAHWQAEDLQFWSKIDLNHPAFERNAPDNTRFFRFTFGN